jgi:ankyrin repeat protein
MKCPPLIVFALLVAVCVPAQLLVAMEGAPLPDEPRPGPKTTLILAAVKGDVPTVKWYIARHQAGKANINASSPGGETALMVAAEAGQEEVVTLLLEAGALKDLHNLNGHTALLFALFQSHLEIANKLIDAGADPDAADLDGETPLMEAAQKGFVPIVRKLIEKGATIDRVSKLTYTARRYALQFKHIDVVQILDRAMEEQLDESFSEDEDGEYIDGFDNDDVPTIWEAASDGDFELLQWHLQNGVSVDSWNQFGETPLMLAAAYGYIDAVQELLARGAQINLRDVNGNSALLRGLLKIHVPVAVLLLERGADPNVENVHGQTPWIVSVDSYLPEISTRLLARGANPYASLQARLDAQERERLHVGSEAEKFFEENGQEFPYDSIWEAAANEDLEVVNWHLDGGYDIEERNEDGETLLIVAAANGNRILVELLIKRGAALDAVDDLGNTALVKALSTGRVIKSNNVNEEQGEQSLIAKILLDAGANPKLRNILGRSALQVAIQQGLLDAIRPLIVAGADVNERTQGGDYDYTLIMNAAYLFQIEIMSELANAGADINARDDDDVTALMIAASRGSHRVVKPLLDLKANIGARDIVGRTALDYARLSKNVKAIALLEEAEKNLEPLVTTPLIRAINRGEVNTVRRILEHKVDVNEQDELGQTAILAAARIGSMALVEILLSSGAALESRNKTGFTPLIQAVSGGFIEIASLLLDRGANVNAEDAYDGRPSGRTPLLWVGRVAIGAPEKVMRQVPIEKSVRMLKLLLARGADPSHVDHVGRTALDWAEITPAQEPLAVILRPVTPQRARAPAPQAAAPGPKAKAPKAQAKQKAKAVQPLKAKAPKAAPKGAAKGNPPKAKAPKAPAKAPKKVPNKKP